MTDELQEVTEEVGGPYAQIAERYKAGEELSDEVREYDRAPMREMIALVESAGLAVTR